MIKKLALGTVQFGLNYGIANQVGRVDLIEAAKILALCRESGITTLDTANGYGDSEAILGSIGVNTFDIITKLPAEIPNGKSYISWVSESIKLSLSRLKVSALYSVLLHRAEMLTLSNSEELYLELKKLKDAGIVQKIGVSIYSPDILEKIVNKFEIDLVQAPLNIFDRSLINSGWLKRLKDRGIEVHIRSAFLQGLLLLLPKQRPEKFNRWNTLFHKWDSWLEENNISSLSACIQFIIQNPFVDKLVVGVDNFSHLKEIIKFTKTSIDLDFDDNLQSTDKKLINPSLWNKL